MNITSAPPDAPDRRQYTLLDAAVGVFARFGFRKTSMDDIARAAGVSRQGLYLLFSNKEELFRRALGYSLSRQLSSALAVLSQHELSLEQRLVAACDEWSGRFIGTLGADAADLMCASTALAGDTLTEFESRFEGALAGAIAGSGLLLHCQRSGVCHKRVAHALHATARGLKQSSKTRQEFVQSMSAAVTMFCAPLGHQATMRGK